MKKALFLLIVIASLAKLSFCQKHEQEKIDSLFTVLKTAKEDTAKVNTLNFLANLIASNNPDTALYLANHALALAIKLNYKMGITVAQLTMSEANINLGKYDEALKTSNNALKLCNQLLPEATGTEKTGGKAKILIQKARSYNIIGIIYDNQGNYPEALKNYLASLKIGEEIGDKSNIARSHGNIGIIYSEQGNYAEALKYYFASLKLSEELGDKNGKAFTLTSIGNVYAEQCNYAEALKNYFVALKLSEELGDKNGKAFTLNSIGIVYAEQGNYAEALKKFFAYLKIAEEIGDKGGMANCFNNIGLDYIKLKKYSDASRYLNKGFSLAKEIGSLIIIRNSYFILSELDSAQANFKRSLENYKMYITYRDNLVNEENTKKTVQIQMQYEFDKKESLAKAEQEKKDAIALKEMQKQKLLRNGFVGGLAVLLIFVVIIFIIMRQREKIRLIKKERNRISRELHDDIGAELTRITVISQNLQKKTNKDDEMQEKLGKISEAGKKVLGSIGEIIWTMNPQKNNLESIFGYIRRYVSEYLEMSGIEVNIEFPDEIPANSVSDEYRRNIFLVIKEAIYNITKHSKATRVRLSMNFRKRWAECEISDNGTGFSVTEKQNWGNGLSNMNQRMKDIGGDFQISSDKNNGTLIKLTFPVH